MLRDQRRRAGLGALLCYFVGLYALLGAIKDHRTFVPSAVIVGLIILYAFALAMWALSVFLVIRWRRGQGLKFNLRGLLLAIAVTAVSLAIARTVFLDDNYYRRSLWERALARTRVGDLDGADTLLRRAAERYRDPRYSFQQEHDKGWGWIAGRLAERDQNYQRAVDAIGRIGSRIKQDECLLQLSPLLIQQGAKKGEVEAYLRRVEEVFDPIAAGHLRGYLTRGIQPPFPLRPEC